MMAGSSLAQDTNPYAGYKVPPSEISSAFKYEHKFTEILGSKIAYVDEGDGDPILFLSGQPTSSYLWRNIMPFMGGCPRRLDAFPETLDFETFFRFGQLAGDVTENQPFPGPEAGRCGRDVPGQISLVQDWVARQWVRIDAIDFKAAKRPGRILIFDREQSLSADEIRFPEIHETAEPGIERCIFGSEIGAPAMLINPVDDQATRERLDALARPSGTSASVREAVK